MVLSCSYSRRGFFFRLFFFCVSVGGFWFSLRVRRCFVLFFPCLSNITVCRVRCQYRSFYGHAFCDSIPFGSRGANRVDDEMVVDGSGGDVGSWASSAVMQLAERNNNMLYMQKMHCDIFRSLFLFSTFFFCSSQVFYGIFAASDEAQFRKYNKIPLASDFYSL